MRCSVVFGVTLRLLVIKHFVVFSHNQHCRILAAMCHNLRDHVDNTWPVAALTAGTKARYRLSTLMPPLGGVSIEVLLCRLAWRN